MTNINIYFRYGIISPSDKFGSMYFTDIIPIIINITPATIGCLKKFDTVSIFKMNIKYKVILIYKQIKAGILEGLYIVINDVSDAPAGFFYVYNKDNRFKLMLD